MARAKKLRSFTPKRPRGFKTFKSLRPMWPHVHTQRMHAIHSHSVHTMHARNTMRLKHVIIHKLKLKLEARPKQTHPLKQRRGAWRTKHRLTSVVQPGATPGRFSGHPRGHRGG